MKNANNPEQTSQLKVDLTDRQSAAWRALDRPDIRRVLYGGAKGGGKSWFLCVWSFMRAYQISHDLGLRKSPNPPHIGWIGRKLATDFAATTLQTWRQTIPEEYYQIRSGTDRDSKHILIMDRVAIDFGGLDRQEHINKFNSSEYAFFCIDQAEETERDEVSVLRGSLRLTLKGRSLDYKELYTANPRACWLRDDFITEVRPGNVFVPALPSDNAHLPSDYEQTLTDAFGHRAELLAAYLHGDWSQIEDAQQCILDRWLQHAITHKGVYQGKILACDVARFGDDKTAIMLMSGTDIEHAESHPQTRTTEVSNRLLQLSRDNRNCAIVVDACGVGAGVVDELVARGREVIAFNSAESADNKDRYYNRRAEAWWKCAEGLARGDIGCTRMSPELRKQLAIPRYEHRNGRILIESKESIKARLGYSPDLADCYVMGVWSIARRSDADTCLAVGDLVAPTATATYNPMDYI